MALGRKADLSSHTRRFRDRIPRSKGFWMTLGIPVAAYRRALWRGAQNITAGKTIVLRRDALNFRGVAGVNPSGWPKRRALAFAVEFR